MGIFRQADADLDAGKWIPDPFQAATLAATLTLPLSVNEPLKFLVVILMTILILFSDHSGKASATDKLSRYDLQLVPLQLF